MGYRWVGPGPAMVECTSSYAAVTSTSIRTMPGTRRTKSLTTNTWLSSRTDPYSTTTPRRTVAEIAGEAELSTTAMASLTAASKSSSE